MGMNPLNFADALLLIVAQRLVRTLCKTCKEEFESLVKEYGEDEIKRMVMKQILVEELREQAISDGMTTLKQDGIYKIFKGDTN
jgi:type II secretory ATPase GspE/PulE/Tfp pilus assembly ATPase PilB-like protein